MHISCITKFPIGSLAAHPDFTAGSWTMDALPSGTEMITSESGQTIGSITTESVSTSSYLNPATSYS